jgi:hypothetical protein
MNEDPLSVKINQLIDTKIIEYIESPSFTEQIFNLIPVYNCPG